MGIIRLVEIEINNTSYNLNKSQCFKALAFVILNLFNKITVHSIINSNNGGIDMNKTLKIIIIKIIGLLLIIALGIIFMNFIKTTIIDFMLEASKNL